MRFSRLKLSVGYLIYFKFTRVSSIIDTFLYWIKETNWLICKGMRALLFDVFNGCSLVKKLMGQRNLEHLLTRKSGVLKTCRRSKFLANKIWRNALASKSKKVQIIFWETFIVAFLSSAVFRLQNHVTDFV